MCHDFSSWKADTERCISRELNYDNMSYTFPPLCNQTGIDCLKSLHYDWRKYCPNNDERCESNDEEEHFFCNDSKTCIPKGEHIQFTFI